MQLEADFLHISTALLNVHYVLCITCCINLFENVIKNVIEASITHIIVHRNVIKYYSLMFAVREKNGSSSAVFSGNTC